MSIPEYSGRSNDTLEIAIKINNANSFVAFQTDVALPPQVSYIPNSAALTGRSNGHMISATLLQNNVLRILAFSVNQSSFNGDTGSVAKFKVKLKTEPGSYPLQLVNPIISNANSSNILTSSENGSITIVSPKIYFYPADIDFGRIPLWSSSDQYVYIQNQGSSDLVISRLSTENQYFRVVGDTSFTIEPWGNRAITIRFNSLKKGSYSTKLNIRSNDPSNSVASVQLTAVAFAVNELHGLPALGRSGYPVDLYFSLNNMEPITGFQFDIVTPNALSFIQDSIFLTGRRGDHIVTANYISPNRLRVIAFSPTNKRFTDSLGNIVRIKFDINGTGGNHYYSLENVILSDSAANNVVSAAYPSYVNIASPDIQGSSDIFFGEVSVTDTAAANYQIFNQGNDTLRISAITSNDPSFWTGFASPLIIPEGSDVTLNVFFHKPVKGNYTGRLMIRSNDPDSDPFYINLSATAFVPNYMIAQSMAGLTNETVTTAISVNNHEPFVAFQVDYIVPDGLVYIPNSARLTNRSVDHTVSVASIGSNTYRIVAFSPTQKQFKGINGEIVNLSFSTGGNTGEFPLVLTNGILSNSASQNIIKGTQNGTLILLNRPGAPNLISPLNEAVNVSLSPRLNWLNEPNSSFYSLEFATDSLFVDTIFTRSYIIGTEFQLSDLSYSSKYFWRVSGSNAAGAGLWSDAYSFTTIVEKPTVPQLVSPESNSTGLLNPITVNWKKSLRAEKYQLQVSTNSLFTNLVVNDANLIDTGKVLPNLSNHIQYYWRVRAVNAGGQSDWSTVWNFKTLGNPYASTLITPLDASINQPLNGLTFKWTKAKERIETIQKYQLQISTDSLFTTVFVNDSTLTDTSKIVGGMGYLTKYFWRVRAQNQTGWGDWSSVWRLTTIIEKPTIPVLALPVNGSKGLLNPISTKWNKSLRAEKYTLQVSTDSLFGSFVLNDTTLTDTTKLLPILSYYSQYYWRVKAANVGGESEWSTVCNFKTLGNPYASNPVQPADQAVIQLLNGLTFQWTKAKERIEAIQKYQLQLSTDSLFGSFVVNDTTLTDTTRIVNGLSYLTKYFWRVRAKNETGWGDWSNVSRFTTIIEKPSVPTLAMPLNNSKGLLNPITAKWNKSVRVEKYELQVSTDSLFGSFIVSDSTLTDTTKILPNLSNYTQYYWRVKAVNVGGQSDWSSIWNFKTLGNPYASTPVQPADQTVNQPLNGLTFKWTKAKERIETVIKYQVQISTDSLFTTTFINDSTLTDTVKIVDGLSYLTKHFWRVRAQNQTGWGEWSSTWRFTTIIEKPTVPLLASPGNNSLGLLNPIATKWNKALRAEKYHLQVSTDNLFTTFVVNDSTVTDTTKLLPNLENYSQYYWRVKAINVGGESDWSTVWNFKTLGNPYASTPLTPLDAAVNQPLNGLTFKWTKAKERIETIQKYQLQISTDSLFTTVLVNDSTLTDTAKTVNGMGYLTKYFWRVRAQNQTGWGDWSAVSRFTTVIQAPTVPVLLVPLNNSTGLVNPISAKWNGSLRSERYKIEVSTDSSFSNLIFSDTTLVDTSTLLPNLSNFTRYFWRVKGINVGGESGWSAVWNFKTLGNPNATNLLIPFDASINQPLSGLTFKWNKASNQLELSLAYQFQLSTDSLFTIVFVNDSTLTDTTKIVNGMSYLTKYFWRVRAQNETGWGDWSSTWRFTTIIEKPTVPVLASPLNNALGLLNPITSKWHKSLRAEKYHLQVSTDNLFANLVVNDSTISDTGKVLPTLSNYTQYFWRVKAMNIGDVSEWSTVWNFKTLGNPYASTPLTPLDAAVNQPLNGLTFKWTKAKERIETIQKYQFQLSTDSLFTTVLVNDSTLTDTTKIVNGMSYLTKYFWRVRAKNETGWGDWSITSRFTSIIERPVTPVLANPLNDALGLLNPISVNWNKALRTEKYHLQVSTDNLFATLAVNDSTISDTSKVLPNISNYTKYYWRVRAANVGGESDWSAVWNFKTLGNPYASTPVQPVDLAVNQPLSGLTFKWTKAKERIETVSKYQFQLSTDSLFGSVVISDSTLTDTSRIVNGLSYLTKYFWRVRAQNQTGWGDWSNVLRFTTIIERPTVPVLALPVNGSKGLLNPITAKWIKSLRVEKYKLQVSTDSLFGSFVVNDTTLTDTTKLLPNLANYAQYYWRVKAVNVGGESAWSAAWNFKTLGNPYASNLITPLDTSINQPLNGLTFKWTKAQERIETIQKYQFQISTDSLFTTLFINDSTLTDTSRIVNGMGYLTKYFWRVRAKNETGWGDWSAAWKFTTIIEKPSVPTLAMPLNNSKGLLNPITAKWNKSVRVEKYKLQISTDSLFSSFIVSDSTLTDTTKILPNLSNYTQYYWRVKAVNVGGQSDWSSVWNFKTLGNPYASSLIEPANGSVNHPLNGLTFNWTKAKERIETISKYQFQLSTDSLFGSLIVNDTTLTDTTRIVSGLSYLTQYFWRVRAQNQTGVGDWSAAWKFTTIIDKPTVPALASPANNSLGLLSPIGTKWNKALRAEKYHLQVSTDNTFASLIVNDSTITDTNKVLPNLTNYTQYFWRVKAINIGGQSDWSTVWNFKTLGSPYASTPVQPADQAVNQPLNGLTFKWSKAKERIETISKYQFQISTDSLFTTVLVSDSTLTDTIKVVGGMGYLTKYFWRVRAQNQTGWGDWSAVWKFTTIIEKPTVPMLASPGNNSLGLLNPIASKWDRSLRAEKYHLQVSADNTFASLIVDDTTVTDTNKVLPNLSNYNHYYWRVKAVNVGGESDWSSVWNFKTLGNPYASNLYEPLNNTVNLPLNGITFKWSKAKERIETISRYQFQISTDSLFTTVFVNDSTLTDTSRIVNGLNFLTKLFWRVRAQNQTGWGDWSTVWKFTTIIEKPTVPLLALPGNNSLGLLNPITVKWNKSLRAEKYHLQLSTDNTFASFIVNDSTITDTNKFLPNLTNYTQYYWRVKAANDGGQSDWSTVWNLKTLGNPSASKLYEPLNNSVSLPLDGVTFKWSKANERIETLSKYHFQVSTDSLFTTVFISDTTLTDTSRIVNGLSYLTKYFWRVRAQNQTGWGDWSAIWKFTTIIEKPTVPVLASPANNSLGLLNPIVAKWSESLRVQNYHLQISTNYLFSSLVLNDSSLIDTSKQLPNLTNFTHYYWRVKAVNDGGVSDWSTVWNFKTLGNPNATNLLIPFDASIDQPLDGLTFKWNKASEQVEVNQTYQFQLSLDSLFGTMVLNDSTLTDTTRIVNGLSYHTRYFWRVRAGNLTGWGDWSNVWRFTTIVEKPSVPTLASPGNDSLGVLNPVTAFWNKTLRAEKYHIQVSTNNEFSTLVLSDSSVSDTSKLLPYLSNYTKYFWRVKALNAGGESYWSITWNFKTLGNPYASNLHTPLNNAVNLQLNGVSFKWSKAKDRIETVGKYQIQISTDSLFGSFLLNNSNVTDTTLIVNGLSYLTKYFWRVRAQNETGWGDWSETWCFTTITAKPTVPVLESPINNALGLSNTVTAKWNRSQRGERYHLQISIDYTFVSLIVNDSTITDTNKVLQTLSNYTQYFWRVKATNIGGQSDWSSVWNFKTLGTPYGSNLYEPLNNAENLPLHGITFKWSKAKERIETVSKYQFQVSTDSLFTTLFINDSTLTDTSRVVIGMGYLTKYFWRVRAQSETGWGDWSAVWKFTTIIEKPTVSALASPANNSLGLLSPIATKWDRSLRAEKYHMQVSTDNSFTSLIVNDSTITDTNKVLPNLSNYNHYYWRVKAVNVGGESDWSSVWNFKTLGNPYASNLYEPLNNTVNLPLNGITFKWSKAKERIETVSKYQFQVSTDSLFGTLFINDSTLTDTSRTVNGMSYLTKYFWRMRAQNETGWGNWSAIWQFTTIIEKPTVPVLASPLNNALGLLNPIISKWHKSVRAEKYRLQVSTDNLFANLVVNDSTIADTGKVLPTLSNYTQYFWRVKAVNIGGESDWSSVWNFKTLGNPYASTPVQPADLAVNQPLNGLTFRWTKAKERIESVQKYQFQVSTDSLFGTLFINDSTLTDTSRIVNGMSYLTKYFWRIRAKNETGWGDWSIVWRFTTIIEKPTVPVLATPANGSLGILNPVSVSWKKALRVETYSLQVSTDSLFGSFIVVQQNLVDTSKVLPVLSNYTKYFWRVKTVNVGGESNWSNTFSFKTLGNPYASTPMQPADQAVNQPINGLVIKWTKAKERIEAIQKYQLQLSTDSLFGSLFVNDSTLTDTSRIVNGMGYLTKYFWRVRAMNETGWGDWSAIWRFTTIVEKPAIPQLAAPLDNAVGLINPVTAKWNKALRVEKYYLQLSADNSFTSLIVNDSTVIDTNKVLPVLSNYTQYYWRVKAMNVGGVSDWSTVWKFKTLGNPYASNPVEPLNNSINHPLNGVMFKWTKAKERIEAIQKYQLQLSTDSLFGSFFLNDSTLTDTSHIVNGLSYLTKYFWRVRATNETGWGDWSSTWRFTTIIERPAIPLLASPANNSTQQLQPVTLKWRPALRASIYTLEVSEDPAFGTLFLSDSTITDTLRVLPQLDAPKTFYWRVKARNIGGASEFSEVWNFRTLGLPLSVNLVSPLNGAVNQPVNNLLFVWSNGGEQTFRPVTANEEPKDKPTSLNSVKGAGPRGKTGGNQSQPKGGSFSGSPQTIGKYWLEITTDTLGATFFYSDSTITDTTKLVSGFTHLTGYFWRVKARNEVGWGNFTVWSGFTTIIERPGVTLLVSPENQSIGLVQPITVKWRTAPRAEKYTLEVSDSPGFTSIIVRDTNLTDTVRVLPALSPLQEYYWRVYSVNTGGISDTSAVWRFKTLGTPTTVNLVYPADNALNIPVDITFTWTRATDQEAILGYWFELATDTAAALIIKDTLLTDTLKAVNQLANNTSYFWRVRSKNETGWGNFTAWGRFKTVKKLIAPPTNLVATALEVGKVSLIWTDNSDNETGFVIARKTGDSTSLDPLVILDSVAAGVTQYLDSLVSDTTLYSYIVVGYNNDTISLPSNYAQVFTLTGIKELFADQLPKNFDLYQNYPNPFNPSTMIRFAIPRESRVRIELYSMQGELITVLMSEEMTAGYYETRLEIPNYASGIYLYRIIAQPIDGSEPFTNTKKLILVK